MSEESVTNNEFQEIYKITQTGLLLREVEV